MHLSKSLNNLSHHAYLLVGTESVRAELISILEKQHKLSAQANPDFYERSYENFTVDDARELKATHSTRPIGASGKKIFILKMNAITIEAQNALLKLLEEPAEYAHFFLIIPSAHVLLPTVKSRLNFVDGERQTTATCLRRQARYIQNSDSPFLEDAQKFIKMSPVKRLDVIKKLVEDISKEKKTKQDAIDFLNAIQAVVYEEKGVKGLPAMPAHAERAGGKLALETIEHARTYMNDRAPSIKMLLEYVALSI